MVADRILKNFQLFVSAKGYAGRIEELQIPKLSLKTEDYQAAGMDAPIALDMGLEKLEANFTLTGYDEDVLALFGLRETNPAQLIAKGALEDLNGSVTPVVVEIHGILTAVEPDAWKPAAVAKLKFTVNCRYFRQEIGGKTIHEIDLLNYKRLVNGMDQLAGIRDAIGM